MSGWTKEKRQWGVSGSPVFGEVAFKILNTVIWRRLVFRVDQWFGILASISIYDLVLFYDGTSGTLLLSTNCSRFQTLWELSFVNLLKRVGSRIQSLWWKGLGMTGLTWIVSALWFLSVWDPGKVIFKAETFWSNQWLLIFSFFFSYSHFRLVKF